jgi:hypothetical protein
MAGRAKQQDWQLEQELQQRTMPMLKSVTWVLRITEMKDKPAPVFVIKERLLAQNSIEGGITGAATTPGKTSLRDRGMLHGQSLRRCLPVIRNIIGGVSDDRGVPLELGHYIGTGRISFRGNLPLDEDAGMKLALIFKLQERMVDLDRVELLALRVNRFSREEAAYWLSRATQYGEAGNRWAQAGMRIMLGGQPGDKEIQAMLSRMHN